MLPQTVKDDPNFPALLLPRPNPGFWRFGVPVSLPAPRTTTHGIATYGQAGTQFGYRLGGTMLYRGFTRTNGKDWQLPDVSLL